LCHREGSRFATGKRDQSNELAAGVQIRRVSGLSRQLDGDIAQDKVQMFSRRTIQSLLNELCKILSETELGEIVGRLNSPRDRLAFTWEVAVLYGLSRVRQISYHVPLPDGRKPDVAFAPTCSSQICIVADITTVSDAGYHDNNPVEAFSDEFSRVVQKAGLNPRNFHFQIESQTAGNKIKLRLPKRGATAAMLKKHVLPFLRKIKVSGHTRDQLVLKEPELSITVSYDRQQRYLGWGHRMYSQARSIEQNPLWNRLKEKAGQLRNTDGLISGAIICDGGCSLLSSSVRDIGSFSADDIIRQFLWKRSSLDFVYTITTRRGYGSNASCSFHGHAWTRDPATKPLIESVMRSALASLPTPIFDAQNAAIQAQLEGYDGGTRTNLEIGIGSKIMSVRVSARALLEVLAGKYSPSEIDLLFGGSNEPDIPGLSNPFKSALAEGQMISEIGLEPVEGKDDDRITIKFGGPDPAVSPFRIKKARMGTG
jgi:hypothetical protein